MIQLQREVNDNIHHISMENRTATFEVLEQFELLYQAQEGAEI